MCVPDGDPTWRVSAIEFSLGMYFFYYKTIPSCTWTRSVVGTKKGTLDGKIIGEKKKKTNDSKRLHYLA